MVLSLLVVVPPWSCSWRLRRRVELTSAGGVGGGGEDDDDEDEDMLALVSLAMIRKCRNDLREGDCREGAVLALVGIPTLVVGRRLQRYLGT